jgi:hypothetical protein
VVSGVDQERQGPSYFISLVLGPLNSLLWYVPSSRYIWSSAPILNLQEQIKDIIISSNVHQEVANIRNRIGNVLKDMGRHEEALVEYPGEQALEVFLSIHGEEHTFVADSLNNIGVEYGKKGDRAAATEISTKTYNCHVSLKDTLN